MKLERWLVSTETIHPFSSFVMGNPDLDFDLILIIILIPSLAVSLNARTYRPWLVKFLLLSSPVKQFLFSSFFCFVSMTIRNGRDKVAPSNIYRHSLTKMVGSSAIAPWTFLGVFWKIFCHPLKKKIKKKNPTSRVESVPVCKHRASFSVVVHAGRHKWWLFHYYLSFLREFVHTVCKKKSCNFVECVLDIWVTKKKNKSFAHRFN